MLKLASAEAHLFAEYLLDCGHISGTRYQFIIDSLITRHGMAAKFAAISQLKRYHKQYGTEYLVHKAKLRIL